MIRGMELYIISSHNIGSGTGAVTGGTICNGACGSPPLTGTLDIGAAGVQLWDNNSIGLYVELTGGGTFTYDFNYIIRYAGAYFASGNGTSVHASIAEDGFDLKVRMTYSGSLTSLSLEDDSGNLFENIGSFDATITLTSAEKALLENEQLVYVVGSSPVDFEAPLLKVEDV